ncbi:MAG: hypothetical protein ACREGC_01705, partial [Minisyncoccia bacterium]
MFSILVNLLSTASSYAGTCGSKSVEPEQAWEEGDEKEACPPEEEARAQPAPVNRAKVKSFQQEMSDKRAETANIISALRYRLAHAIRPSNTSDAAWDLIQEICKRVDAAMVASEKDIKVVSKTVNTE